MTDSNASSRQADSLGATIRHAAMQRVDSLVLVWLRFAVAVAVYVWADSFLQDETYRAVFVDARVLLKYHGFEWVGLWPGDGMRWHFVVTKIAAGFLAIGFLTRVASALLCGSIWYVLLVDCQIYVNHYYLLAITAGLLVFLPVSGQWSVDRKLGIQRPSETCWRWQIWLVRFQIGIPYTFGAIAKLNGDWFRGQPAQLILRNQDAGAGRTWADIPGMVDLFVYGGFGYDLMVVPMLLWRPTRWVAVVMSIGFHLTNAMTLTIGVFPWFMLATLVVFFPPETLRRRLRLFLGNDSHDELEDTPPAAVSISRVTRFAIGAAILYAMIHCLLPIRPALFPGDSNWNERGHRFAWRMMLRNKQALTHYLVVDRNSDDFLFVPSTTVLTGYQAQRADHHPELIRQTAVAISEAAAELGVPENRVYALALVSLNGRRPKPMVDPYVDLTEVQRGWWRDGWVDDDLEPMQDPPWTTPTEQWWTVLELPEPFKALRGRTPTELQDFLSREATKKATP
ncbi:HTTM domain-containing protein [Rubripirellula reticaptiva]|uniref:Vitamin K-dependent gamma-carboxylase n=1 Tax=Rubripirellula reticaptiva TaxID=2528013 RepID=A0A5C6F274_9BACT|nr:HTTM domain-containing protein [Rubripirellula reticaptiva]TWU55448.1 Vitamin K-dependent gamma-carboxylase [Rubripirellula reticaptiva]